MDAKAWSGFELDALIGECILMATTIRDYRTGDQEAAYFVCVKTGNQGDDGEPFYKEDPDALGRIFVGP